jgi:hypothetical protein
MKILNPINSYYIKDIDGSYKEVKIVNIKIIDNLISYNDIWENQYFTLYENTFVKVNNGDKIDFPNTFTERNVWFEFHNYGVIQATLVPIELDYINGTLVPTKYKFTYNDQEYELPENTKFFSCKEHALEEGVKIVKKLDGTEETIIGINELIKLTLPQQKAVTEFIEAVEKLKKLNVGIINNEDNGTVSFIDTERVEVISDECFDGSEYVINASNAEDLEILSHKVCNLYMNWDSYGVFIKRKNVEDLQQSKECV